MIKSYFICQFGNIMNLNTYDVNIFHYDGWLLPVTMAITRSGSHHMTDQKKKRTKETAIGGKFECLEYLSEIFLFLTIIAHKCK